MKADPKMEDHPIQDFYKNTHVLITGATGFMGKALLEKLLRSCDGIKQVFVIIRRKKGLSSEERCEQLLNSNVFDRIRTECPERLHKIKPIFGDVGMDNLGLSDHDEEMLVRTINIVFHSAATVKFQEPIGYTINLNVRGTKRMLELANKMRFLKVFIQLPRSFVHLSTAFCHTEIDRVIEEKVYPTEYDPDTLLNLMDTLPEKLQNALTDTLKGTHQNTYTLTKCLGENMVSKYSQYIPVCIVRPSVVSAALEEPTPGWIDSFHGASGILMQIYNGTLKAMLCRPQTSADLLPVDYSVNMIICAAWHHHTLKNDYVPVYNSVVGKLNSVTWKFVLESCVEVGKAIPSMKSISYPSIAFTTCVYMFNLYLLYSAKIPAFIMDTVAKMSGTNSMILKRTRILESAVHAVKIFTCKHWEYTCDNTVDLFDKLAASSDASKFPCDVRLLDWKTYMFTFNQGMRTYLLNDPMDTLPKAKNKMRIFHIFNWILRIIGICILYKLFRLFCHCYSK